MGDESGRPFLRALGRVLGDLTNLGYDAQWATVRAADVGAPHKRARLFIVAYPTGDGLEGGFTGRPLSELPPTESNEPLLPTPCAERPDGRKSAAFADGRANFHDIICNDKWGEYAPTFRRWEQVLGRPAPDPTEPSRTGKPQLSPAFVEWMMGLPQGWVTDVDISLPLQIRALGNGVVPQQGAAAITHLLGRK